MLTPLMTLPSTIPTSGIMTCGAYQGSGRSVTSAKLVTKIANALRVPKDRRLAVSGATNEGLREMLEACWKLTDRAQQPARALAGVRAELLDRCPWREGQLLPGALDRLAPLGGIEQVDLVEADHDASAAIYA